MADLLPPSGIRLVADEGLRRLDEGRVLVGGSPLRIVTLSEAGAAVVEAWVGGRPLAAVRSARVLARRLLDAGMLHPVVTPVDTPVPVTVVVPVKDDADGLARLLPTIGSPTVITTVVVDDGSGDADAIARVARAHGATLERRETSGGPGVARMTGLDRVETAFVAFVDADVELPLGWWTALSPHFDDPAVVAVAPRVASAPGPSLRERYEAVHSPLDLGASPASVAPRRRMAYVPSAVLTARVDAVRAAGGFDPDLRTGEDVDLVWRLADRGGTVRYAPEVRAQHRPRGSWLAMVRQRVDYGASAAALAERHGAAVAPARCSRWSLGAWGLVALGRPLSGLAVAAGSTAALARRLSGLPDGRREALRIAGWGNLHAGTGLARAVSRVWWPVALPLARFRPLRRAVIGAMVLPAAAGWVRGLRPAGPVRSVALRIADDMAYGIGVWRGVVSRRDPRALLPELTEWPGGRGPVETDTVATR